MGNITDKLNEKFNVHGSNIADAINQITSAFGSNIADAVNNVVPGSGGGSGESSVDLWPAEGEYTKVPDMLTANVFGIKDLRSFGPYSSATDYYEHDLETDYESFINDPLNSEQLKAIRALGFSDVTLKKLLANSTYFIGSDSIITEYGRFAGYGLVRFRLDGSGLVYEDSTSISKLMQIDLGDGSGPGYWVLCEMQRYNTWDVPITNGWYQYLDYRSDMTRKTRLTANNVAHLYTEDEVASEPTQLDLYKFYIPVRVYQFNERFERVAEYCGYRIQVDENEYPIIAVFGDIESGK